MVGIVVAVVVVVTMLKKNKRKVRDINGEHSIEWLQDYAEYK